MNIKEEHIEFGGVSLVVMQIYTSVKIHRTIKSQFYCMIIVKILKTWALNQTS